MSFLCSHIKYLGLNLGTEPMFSSSNQLYLPSLTLYLLTTSLLQIYCIYKLRSQSCVQPLGTQAPSTGGEQHPSNLLQE